MASHHKDWHTQLYNALWEDRITLKVDIGNSPYYLFYGKESILPSNTIIPSLHLAQSIQEDDLYPLQQRIYTLLKLEEDREKSNNKLYQHQQLVKIWFDEQSSFDRDFLVGDLVLRWDKQHKDNKKYTKSRTFHCYRKYWS